jgi:pimeloyl-ACP methyl ester carboxylesterase
MTHMPIRGVSLFVEVIGHGVPLVLMHGDPALDYTTMLPLQVLADQFTLVFYDHRCNGHSEGAEVGSMTMENLTADADALRQKEGSLLACGLVILTLTGWATIVGINSPKGKFDILTLGYLALMPTLNEGLVYRGCLLGILNKLLPKKINLLGAWMGWGAVITSLLFSLLHGFGFNNDLSIYIDAIALRNSFVSGFIFAWLRERSSSLLMPVIAHGLEDLFFFLPRML